MCTMECKVYSLLFVVYWIQPAVHCVMCAVYSVPPGGEVFPNSAGCPQADTQRCSHQSLDRHTSPQLELRQSTHCTHFYRVGVISKLLQTTVSYFTSQVDSTAYQSRTFTAHYSGTVTSSKTRTVNIYQSRKD